MESTKSMLPMLANLQLFNELEFVWKMKWSQALRFDRRLSEAIGNPSATGHPLQQSPSLDRTSRTCTSS